MYTMGNRLFDFLVDFVANFAAAVINHPVMNESVLNIVVKGVNKLLEEPDLDKHIMAAGQQLTKNRDVMAHKAGREAPKVAKNFMKGMIHVGNPEEKMKEDSDDSDKNDDTASASHNYSEDGHQVVASSKERTAVTVKSSRDNPDYCAKKKPRWRHPIHTVRHHL